MIAQKPYFQIFTNKTLVKLLYPSSSCKKGHFKCLARFSFWV